MPVRNLVRIPPLRSTFLSSEKDVETILYKLFVENQPYSDTLKKLIYITAADALDNPQYDAIVKDKSVRDLIQNKNIKLAPNLKQEEFGEEKNYILISFDNFVPNATNPQFRNCTVHFDILCHLNNWDLGDYRIRPLKIAGYIDSILNEAKLSGIGTFQFASCTQLVYNEDFAGYSLMFYAIHGSDDEIPREEEE